MNQSFYSDADFQRIEDRRSFVSDDDVRSPFQRDRDRILHSEPFRRLQNKTQVLFPGEYDFYRTRLTHTIEVAQLGRTIAHYLNERSDELKSKHFRIDTDLIEAICLSHDIGHPPFGHLGERILNEIMAGPKHHFFHHSFQAKYERLYKNVRADVEAFNDPGFEANAQNLRIIESLAYSMGFQGRVGFNPTFACWEGVIKYHHTASFIKAEQQKKLQPKVKFIYDSTYRCYDEPQKLLFNQPRELYQKYNFRSLENQIMEIADDIGYSILDVEDAYKSRFIGLHNLDEIKAHVNKYLASNGWVMPEVEGKPLVEWFDVFFKSKIEVRRFKNKFISLLIYALELQYKESYQNYFKMDHQSPRFNYVLHFREAAFDVIIEIFKEIVREFVYMSPHIKQLQYSYPNYILNMFLAFYDNPELLPRETQSYLPDRLTPTQLKKYREKGIEVWSKSRIICDHISGMTDHYFFKVYKKLFDVDEHQLIDLV